MSGELFECVGEIVFVEHSVAAPGNLSKNELSMGEGVGNFHTAIWHAALSYARGYGRAVILPHYDCDIGAGGYASTELTVKFFLSVAKFNHTGSDYDTLTGSHACKHIESH